MSDETKEVIKSRNSEDRMQWPKEKGQKDKQWSTKLYTENQRCGILHWWHHNGYSG